MPGWRIWVRRDLCKENYYTISADTEQKAIDYAMELFRDEESEIDYSEGDLEITDVTDLEEGERAEHEVKPVDNKIRERGD